MNSFFTVRLNSTTPVFFLFFLYKGGYRIKYPIKIAMPLKKEELILKEIIIFTQPLRSGRIWHKVNFLSEV